MSSSGTGGRNIRSGAAAEDRGRKNGTVIAGPRIGNGPVIDWLLKTGGPSLRFNVLTRLLGREETDAEVRKARSEIADSSAVRNILGKMEPEGYWLQKNPRTGRVVGDGVEYGSFGTTHFCLSYLAELGICRDHPGVAQAAERYLSLQSPEGDWIPGFYGDRVRYSGLSCLIGQNIRTFILLGYRDSDNVNRALELLLSRERPDGGYLCGIHEGKYKTKSVKSCIRGSVKVLLAYSELPELYRHKRVRTLAEYFLRRGGIFRSGDRDSLVNSDMERASFPVGWRANIWEVLLGLSRMGLGSDPRLEGAWKKMEGTRDASGRAALDWTPAQSPWKAGKRGEPNGWLTYYTLLAYKAREAC